MLNRRTFIQFLLETPVTDYKTFGNFDKAHSFRHANDRKMVTAEKAVRNIHKKLGRTDYSLNLYFVNDPKVKDFQEYGKVDLDWVQENLPPNVAQHLQSKSGLIDDAINIIYVGNSAGERVPMSPWTLAHRLGHSLEKTERLRGRHGAYSEADNHLHDQVKMIMSYYGKDNFNTRPFVKSGSVRRDELAFKYLFHAIATFKSARDQNIRDYFEVMNELLAQYIITGHIKFNPPPQCIQGGSRGNAQRFCASEDDMQELSQFVDTLARDMEYYVREILGNAVGNIYVM